MDDLFGDAAVPPPAAAASNDIFAAFGDAPTDADDDEVDRFAGGDEDADVDPFAEYADAAPAAAPAVAPAPSSADADAIDTLFGGGSAAAASGAADAAAAAAAPAAAASTDGDLLGAHDPPRVRFVWVWRDSKRAWNAFGPYAIGELDAYADTCMRTQSDAEDAASLVGGPCQAAAAAAALSSRLVLTDIRAQVGMQVGELEQCTSIRRVVLSEVDSTQDLHERWQGPYCSRELTESLCQDALVDMLVMNGICALPTESCAALMLRAASHRLVATDRCVRPASVLGEEDPVLDCDARPGRAGFCSWCRRLTRHEQKSSAKISRDGFCCQSCLRETVRCKLCAKQDDVGMSCVRAMKADAKCYAHTHDEDSVPMSEVDPALLGEFESLCPWCSVTCKQLLAEKLRPPRRNVFRCSACSGRTLVCKSKTHAEGSSMARGYVTMDDSTCWDCQGIPYEQRMLSDMTCEDGAERWCSWCFAPSALFKMTSKNKTGRNAYECGVCGGGVFACQNGSCPNMGRDASVALGIKRQRCDMCRLGEERVAYIQELIEKSDGRDTAMFASKETKRALMSEETEQKRLAFESGHLRSYLCLLMMGWRQRRALTMTLGWSLLESSAFGCPAEEAWEIISKDKEGVQARANQSWETLGTKGTRDADWDECLSRTISSVFGCMRAVPSSNVADPAGKRKRPLKEHLRQQKARYANLLNPMHPRCRQLEDEFLERMYLSQNDGPAAWDEHDRGTADEGYLQVVKALREVGGVANGFSMAYFISAIRAAEKQREADILLEEEEKKKAEEMSGVVKAGDQAKATKRGGKIVLNQGVANGIRVASTSMLGAVAASAIMGISAVLIVRDLVSIVFGSSEGRLVPTIRAIVITRYALILEDILLEEFYPHDEALLERILADMDD